ncbi:mixed lineage kinase domain-like protein isoform 2-T2 [Pelodytes ibericus]
METLGVIFTIAHKIYNLCDEAQSNRKQCKRLKNRLELLLVPAAMLQTQPEKSRELDGVLKELRVVLENAECWIWKYSRKGWWVKVFLSGRIKDEFDHTNDRLRDAAESLQLLLQVERRTDFLKYFNEKVWKRQNQKDVEMDLADLKESLQSGMQSVSDKVDSLGAQIEDQNAKLAALSWNIKEIRATDLRRGELVMERPGHYLYRGEYHKGPVAIKVLKGPLNRDNDYVRKTFQSESETMRRFECVNILRLYGICIDNSHGEPSYSLVMEFCEKGTLRELLSRELDLSWKQRVHMVLDAARAVYRLHHSELKAILHGSLSSSKFLVDGTYCLKLSGFELSKTESSMRRPSNAEKRQESIGWAYMAPETLTNINAYNKCSEVYSLGVVCYEIASGNVPLDGLRIPEGDLGEIHQRLRAEVDAGIPIDCPKILRDIITQSLETDPSNRPTAGVIVDRLIAHLNQAEPKEIPVETSV